MANPLAVDERAVRAVQIGDGVFAVDPADFGVMAGDFGVVQGDGAGRVAPQPYGGLGQFEAAALIDPADDEQCRHGPDSRVLSSNSSILRIKGPY